MKICLSCGGRFEGDSWTCPSCGQAPRTIAGHFAFAPELALESEGFDAAHFAMLAEAEAGNFWFRSRNDLIVWALGRYVPDAKTLLEVGCGTGYVLSGLSRALPNLRLSGSEIYSEGLSFAARRVPQSELFQMDARHVPFESHFDAIGAFDVLEHVAEDEAVIAELARALVPGGGLLVTVPQHAFLWSRFDEVAHHQRRYSKKDLSAKLEAAGLRVVLTTSFVSLLLPLVLLGRSDRKEYDPLAELRLARWLDRALGSVRLLENLAIRAGVRFPLGSSLLAVARRPT